MNKKLVISAILSLVITIIINSNIPNSVDAQIDNVNKTILSGLDLSGPVLTSEPLIGNLGLMSTSIGGFALGDCRNPTLSEIVNSTDEVMDLCDFSNYSIVAINGKAADPSSCDQNCLKKFEANIHLFKQNTYSVLTHFPLSSLYKFVVIQPDIPPRPATYMDVTVFHEAAGKNTQFYEKSSQCETNLEPSKLYKCTITVDPEKINVTDANYTNTNN